MNGGHGVTCRECEHHFEIEREWHGKVVTCPYCETTIDPAV